jgi:hypothetical protein
MPLEALRFWSSAKFRSGLQSASRTLSITGSIRIDQERRERHLQGLRTSSVEKSPPCSPATKIINPAVPSG